VACINGNRSISTERCRVAAKRLPASVDDMTVEAFLDLLRWWAALPSGDRQTLVAVRKHMLD
jgi:hypothetical protein